MYDIDSCLLDIPLLGAEPNLVTLYSTHSGRQQFFRDGGIATPPNIREVYSFDQLVEGLAVLIVNNLYVRRWIFKIDRYIEGKGIGTVDNRAVPSNKFITFFLSLLIFRHYYPAYCDVVTHLDCYEWVVKESIRYGDKWKKQWAQEYARQRIVQELPTILAVCAQPVNRNLFPTWSHYLQVYLTAGWLVNELRFIKLILINRGQCRSIPSLGQCDCCHSGHVTGPYR